MNNSRIKADCGTITCIMNFTMPRRIIKNGPRYTIILAYIVNLNWIAVRFEKLIAIWFEPLSKLLPTGNNTTCMNKEGYNNRLNIIALKLYFLNAYPLSLVIYRSTNIHSRIKLTNNWQLPDCSLQSSFLACMGCIPVNWVSTWG